MTTAARLRRGLARLGLALDTARQQRLLDYLEVLARWNRAYNLTAVREREEMISRHLLDSLALLPWVEGASLLDVGSGAGLPGLPLAIARPRMRVTLLDSLGKRCRFLRQVVRQLELPNVEVVESRVEDWQVADKPALITARAVAALPELLARCRHLFAAETILLAAKGRFPAAEVEALPADFRILDARSLEIPGLDAERHLLRIQRIEVETEAWQR